MIFLLDTSQDIDACADELGVGPLDAGQLITPCTRFSNRGREHFAIDNGGFSHADPKGFISLLKREEPNRDRCLWVVCPDAPFSAARTRELWEWWYPRLAGWPIAYALQNGQEQVPIPWDMISAVFVGGDDQFKYSEEAHACIRAAQWMGKRTHVGRVNTPEHLKIVEAWDVDSIDGRHALYTHMRHRLRDRNAQGNLPVLA